MRTPKFVMALVALVLGLVASSAEAGPFGRFSRRSAVQSNTSCSQSQQGVSEAGCSSCQGESRGYSTGSSNGSAQDVADTMARTGVRAHRGNPAGGYEGIGEGGSPESALSACCRPGNGMAVVDSGTAYGHGRWYACKRYNWR
jgi:hypothetical protein